MKTLVTGSTGFLGSAVLRELLDDGREAKILIRKGANTANIDGLDVEIAYGDLRDSESLLSALNGCEILYHVAAYYSLWNRDQKLIYEINVEGTRKILQAAQKKGLEKIVYTSTQQFRRSNPRDLDTGWIGKTLTSRCQMKTTTPSGHS